MCGNFWMVRLTRIFRGKWAYSPSHEKIPSILFTRFVLQNLCFVFLKRKLLFVHEKQLENFVVVLDLVAKSHVHALYRDHLINNFTS